MEPERDDIYSEASDKKKLLTQMEQLWQVEEQPFISNVPILGPIIAFMRKQWNQVSTQWYVRALLKQQNQFNHLVVEFTYPIPDILTNLRQLNLMVEQQSDLIADRGLSIATLSEGVSRLSARVVELEERLKMISSESMDDNATSETTETRRD